MTENAGPSPMNFAEEKSNDIRNGLRMASKILFDAAKEVGGYSGWGGDISSTSADERAARENRVVILPDPNELFIDIDNDLAFLTFMRNYDKLLNFYAIIGPPKITESPSGKGHKHIVITLVNPITSMERIILQAFLGSDLTREFLGLQRILANDPRPTLFLEPDPNPNRPF